MIKGFIAGVLFLVACGTSPKAAPPWTHDEDREFKCAASTELVRSCLANSKVEDIVDDTEGSIKITVVSRTGPNCNMLFMYRNNSPYPFMAEGLEDENVETFLEYYTMWATNTDSPSPESAARSFYFCNVGTEPAVVNE